MAEKIISENYIRLDFYDVINNKNKTEKAILIVDKMGDWPLISAVFENEEKGLMLILSRDQTQLLINALNDVLIGSETIQ